MATPLDIQANGAVLRYDTNVLGVMEPRLFDAAWLQDSQFWRGSAEGRGQAHFLHFADRDMVLRDFQRGGLVGRIIQDRFVRRGVAYSRAFAEFDLLCAMRSKSLRVPRPVAARYAPSGLYYRASIITERIAQARTLHAILCDRALSDDLWVAVGAAIRTMHDHDVFHSDLNCHNIMIDTDDHVWIIDFDKCGFRKAGEWMQGNLNRLNRSLRKFAAQDGNLNWNETDWVTLLAGYTDARCQP